MSYYLVWVRSPRYRGSEALTYHATEKLLPGALVKVTLQREMLLGIVIKATVKPGFATKPIEEVLPYPPLPRQLIALGEWVRQFYATSIGVVAQQLLPRTFTKSPRSVTVAPKQVGGTLAPLTSEQQTAVQIIQEPNTYLLHGKTGSGKTRIYVELAQRSLSNGNSAIILTPEISLTSQLAKSFAVAFGDRVVVLHSQLTPAERERAWLQILRSHAPLVVIGPRSALFSPLPSVGLIVVDESHEAAYKQEQAPYYHASRVAAQLAHLHGAILVLGSATPSITDYYVAEQRSKPIIRLTQLAQHREHPATIQTVVDLKDRGLFSGGSHLSTPLIEAIKSALERHEQTLIYLNRRGTARLVMCDNCGWQALCPHCDLPLVYHGDHYELRCHTCGFTQAAPSSCPACGHPSILFRSAGTKAIMEELHHIFPHARLQRFDTDNRKAERFEQHYEAVRNGEVDILVGTQLLAKGLDLPRLSTVGVVMADTSLYVPDFSSQERTYQLLTQVLGRVGRGHRQGHAVIQTYHPDHPIITAALADDWRSFYGAELAERRKYLFPPFCHLLKLTCRRASFKNAERAAIQFKQTIEQSIPGIRVEGPAPSFHQKLEGKYQWQLVVKATERSALLSVLQQLPSSGWGYDIDPINLL